MELLKKGIEIFPEDEKLKTHMARHFLEIYHANTQSSIRQVFKIKIQDLTPCLQVEKLLKEVLKLNPYHVEALVNLGVLSARKK